MTSTTEDRSTWLRRGQTIRRQELLELLAGVTEPSDLDVRGARFLGDGPEDAPIENYLDLSPQALATLAEHYRQVNGDRDPPWLNSEGGIDLWGAELEEAYLPHAILQQATLPGANLKGAYLKNVDLRQAHLRGANLQGANLERAQLQGAVLEDARLEGANLQDTELGGANLCRANLRAAHLPGAQLQGADLRLAQLRESYLLQADLQDADLRCAELQRADMYDVRHLDGVRWCGALLDHTRIKRVNLANAIGDETDAHEQRDQAQYHRAGEAYLLLKNNFNQIGRYEDASWAYVKEQQMEKMAFYWEWRECGWRAWRAWGLLWRWLRNWAYELATGYGERPANAVGLGFLIMAAFAVGFWATRAIGNFWDAFVYSLATFATFNLGRTGLNPEGRGVEAASSIEALLGIGVLALVVFTLGNRMSRG